MVSHDIQLWKARVTENIWYDMSFNHLICLSTYHTNGRQDLQASKLQKCKWSGGCKIVGTSNLKIRHGIQLSKTRKIQRFVNILARCMMKNKSCKHRKCRSASEIEVSWFWTQVVWRSDKTFECRRLGKFKYRRKYWHIYTESTEVQVNLRFQYVFTRNLTISYSIQLTKSYEIQVSENILTHYIDGNDKCWKHLKCITFSFIQKKRDDRPHRRKRQL